jgi:hypothetical protein
MSLSWEEERDIRASVRIQHQEMEKIKDEINRAHERAMRDKAKKEAKRKHEEFIESLSPERREEIKKQERVYAIIGFATLLVIGIVGYFIVINVVPLIWKSKNIPSPFDPPTGIYTYVGDGLDVRLEYTQTKKYGGNFTLQINSQRQLNGFLTFNDSKGYGYWTFMGGYDDEKYILCYANISENGIEINHDHHPENVNLGLGINQRLGALAGANITLTKLD